MIAFPLYRAALIVGVALAGIMVTPLKAQESQPSAPAETAPKQNGDAGSVTDGIIVEGQRRRGQLDVEQAPILELSEADIAAEGVTSIADLITQVTEQSGSARGRGGGGRPVILVNGIRVGSFREIANYPPEALDRLEVFPEEVAQRFGFPPDRRVINLILKENYRNAEVELEFEGPSRGGYFQNEQELGFLQISNGARINVSLEANDTSLLTEDERDVIQTPGSISGVPGDPGQAEFRSLVADSRSLEGDISIAKAFIDSGTSISANANYSRSDIRTLQGLNTVLLIDGTGESALRTFGADTPLERRTSSDTVSTSGSLTKPVNAFRLTSTFNGSLSETTQEFDRRFDTTELQADVLSGQLTLDGSLSSSVDAGFDTAFTRNISGSTLTTLRGPVANLPGGELLATFDVGYSWTNFESTDTRTNLPVDLTRGNLSTGVNLVVPITSRRNGFADALGSFTFNAQVGLEHLSDFGTLGDYTLGLTWAPFDNLDLSATYIARDVAPGLTSLGNPEVEFLNTPVFDFVNGETVLATVVTGGNPDLFAETQRDWKFGANWQLPFWQGARFTAEYVRNRSDDVTRGFPTITLETEAAFPDRIIRDANGALIAVDTRFVTFAETSADRLNFTISFRGSIGAGEGGGQRGGGPGGPPQGARPSSGTPQVAPVSANLSAGTSGPSAGSGAQGERLGRRRRDVFAQFRERICADDGLDVLMRLVEAAENGEDLSATIPGFDPQRLERLLSRFRDENGEVSPGGLARLRYRLCSRDTASWGAPRGESPDSPRPAGQRPEGFTAYRAIACGNDGAERIRALVARIDAGEDISDELPGFDPAAAQMMLGRLRDQDGNVSDKRLAQMRERFCASDAGRGADQSSGQNARQASGQSAGGSPRGFNPLARRSFQGFRYFVTLNHQIELENEILIAPGLDLLDQLNGEATEAFGFPRHTSRIQAGIFGNGIGMRLSARYLGETRLNGSGLAGSSDIFFNDIATFDLRLFSEIGQLVGHNEGILKNLRVSLRVDNVFDAQRRVVDSNGDTPINFQPLLIDPVGRFIGVDIRKLF